MPSSLTPKWKKKIIISIVQTPINPPKVESALAFDPIKQNPPIMINKGIKTSSEAVTK